MQTIEYRTIDKSKWPRGPWDDEPDKVQWPDEATGLPCIALRNDWSGHWCGYVGVAPGHPEYGQSHDNVVYSAHGGVNFSAMCPPDADPATDVCHVPGPGEPDHAWWFGFDCCHAWDRWPADREPMPHAVYRTLDFVKAECAKLALQIAKKGGE